MSSYLSPLAHFNPDVDIATLLEYFPKLKLAYYFGMVAHSAVGQVRKYTGEPYFEHPIAVAQTLVTYVPPASLDIEMLQAALLHDVLEDTQVTVETLRRAFGQTVTGYVQGLTNVTTPEMGDRATRHQIELERLRIEQPSVQTIKLADILQNTSSIIEQDRGFALVYVREKYETFQAMRNADYVLRQVAVQAFQTHAKTLNIEL